MGIDTSNEDSFSTHVDSMHIQISGCLSHLEKQILSLCYYFNFLPKTKKEDAIEVNKIVIVSPKLSEKIIKKKIEHKIAHLFKLLEEISESGGNDEGTIRNTLMDAERLKLMIINNYIKYLGNTYASLTLKKIEVIINELRIGLYKSHQKELVNYYVNNYEEEFEEKKGRRGR